MIKRKKLVYLVITVVVIAGVAVGGKTILSSNAKHNSSVSTTNSNKTSVKVIKASMEAMVSNASFKASLEASQEGTVSNKVSGKVIEVLFENGQTVSAGEILAKLDDTDIRNNIESNESQLAASEVQLKAVEAQSKISEAQYNAAQAGLDNPQTNLETAQRNYDRTKALFDVGTTSKSDLETVESALQTAKNDLQSVKTGLGTSEANRESARIAIEAQKANIQTTQTNLNILRDSLQNTIITAPTSGVMDAKNVKVGQYLNVGTAIGTVKNISPIYAVIEAKESDLNYIKVGVTAKFKLNDSDSSLYDGVVKNIDGAADATSRVFKCRIEIDNKDGKLKPGVFGNVQVVTDENKKAITLPLKALGGSEGNYYVFINNNGVAKKQTITTGEISEDIVEIRSGVKDGDSVICTNVGTLQDGDAVKVAAE